MRADARRNREAIATAAAEVFAEHGVEVALEEVSRRAGVGIATLYRNFPTREALIIGVYLHDVDQLCDGIDDLLADLPADDALETWMQRFVGHVAGKRGMALALRSVITADTGEFQAGHDQIHTAMRRLVRAAEDGGAITPGTSPNDLVAAMTGLCLVTDRPDWKNRATHLISILVNGLRHDLPTRP